MQESENNSRLMKPITKQPLKDSRDAQIVHRVILYTFYNACRLWDDHRSKMIAQL